MLRSIQFEEPLCCIKSSNEDSISVALENGEIQIYNYKKMETVKTISAHSSCVKRMCSLSNGNLVSGSEDSDIKLWELWFQWEFE